MERRIIWFSVDCTLYFGLSFVPFLMDWNDVFKEPKDLKRKKLKPSGKGETFIPVISIVCLDKELGIH